MTDHDHAARATTAVTAFQQTGFELGVALWAGAADAQMRALRLTTAWLDLAGAELDRRERWMGEVGLRVGRAQEAGRDATLAMTDALERMRSPFALVQQVAMPILRQTAERAAWIGRELADRAVRPNPTQAATETA